MGKDRKHQRVKGNASAASSSQAQTVISSTKTLSSFTPGSIDFSFFPIPNFSPSSSSSLSLESQTKSNSIPDVSLIPALNSISLELLVLLKKLSKKDTQTKLKALEELLSLIKEKEDLILELIEPWSNLFNKLGVEYDKRIRLHTFTIHCLLVSSIGKQLKSILKNVITTWMLGLYDPDVMNVAESSFHKTFPPHKKETLLNFCWSQLLLDLEDITIKKTPETMSDPRYFSKDEMGQIYARNVSCAIELIAYLYKFNPSIPFLESTQFRDHLRSPYPSIRKAMAVLVQTLVQTHQHDQSITSYWLDNFLSFIWEEKIPLVATEAWSTLLLLLQCNPTFFQTNKDTKLNQKILKKLPKYVSQDMLHLPIAFTALPVFLHFYEDAPLEPLWTASKHLASSSYSSIQSSASLCSCFWQFIMDLLKLMQKRNFEINSKIMEIIGGVCIKNEWSLAMPTASFTFLNGSTKLSLNEIEPLLIRFIEEHFINLNVTQTIDVLNYCNFSHTLDEFIQVCKTHLSTSQSTSFEFHTSLHALSYMKLPFPLLSPSSPLDLFRLSFDHCLDCVQHALFWTTSEDEQVINLILNQSRYPLLSLLSFLDPYPSTLLTNFIVSNHFDSNELISFAFTKGFLQKEILYTYIMESQRMDLLELLQHQKIDSISFASWCLQHATDELWSNLTFKLDLSSVVLEVLFDDTVSLEAWIQCFTRAQSPPSLLFSTEVIHRLRYTKVIPIHHRFVDIYETDSQRVFFASTTAQKLVGLLQSYSIWEDTLDWQYLLALIKAASSYEDWELPLLVSSMDFTPSVFQSLLNTYIFFPTEESSPSYPTTVDLITLQLLVQTFSLPPAYVLQLSFPSLPEIHSHRLLAAFLSGTQQESIVFETRLQDWVRCFYVTKDVQYLMLINAFFTTSFSFHDIVNENDEDTFLSILDELLESAHFLHYVCIALFFSLYPSSHMIPYCWHWLHHTDPMDGLFPSLVHFTLQLLDQPEMALEEKNLIVKHCQDFWMNETLCTPELSRFISNLPCDTFDEEKLYAKLSSTALHLQLTAFILLQRKIGINVQNWSLQLELTEFDETRHSFHIHSVLLDIISKSPSIFTSNHEHFQYLYSWMLIFHHFHNASLRLKYLWMQSLPFPVFFTYLTEQLIKSSSSYSLSDWDWTEFHALSIFSSNSLDLVFSNALAFLYFQALTFTPKHIRLWWNELRDKQYRKKVENLTTTYFSPLILQRERDALGVSLDSLKVKVINSPTVTQIQAHYAIEEHTIDLHIAVPMQYPLLPLDIQGGKQVAIASGKWRSWILTCRKILSQQNASILNALKTFQSNIEFHLQGVNECSICFSIVGVSCNTLPSQACRTCKNKFHGACLYTWLRTSAQSTCPLCRSQF